MIKWLVGIAILVLIVVSPRFRKFAVVFVVIASVIGVALWQYQEYERNKSKSSIHPSELVLQNMEFKPLDTDYEFEMTGRVINNSEKYTLKSIVLIVTTQECSDPAQTDCLIVSEQQESLYLTVPPHQARYFKKDIYLYSNQNIKKDLVWGHSIRYAVSE